MKKKYSTEEILNSLDGASKAEPSPFLYTRIQSRLNDENKSPDSIVLRFLTRPSVALAIAMMFVLINGFILAGKIKGKGNTEESNQPLAVEYVQHVVNPYETNETPE
ncbi:MAG: hypothetical protein ACK5AO_01810 [bacterium]